MSESRVGKRDVLAEATDRSAYALNMPAKLRILSEVHFQKVNPFFPLFFWRDFRGEGWYKNKLERERERERESLRERDIVFRTSQSLLLLCFVKEAEIIKTFVAAVREPLLLGGDEDDADFLLIYCAKE
jgi:hypothetical protein